MCVCAFVCFNVPIPHLIYTVHLFMPFVLPNHDDDDDDGGGGDGCDDDDDDDDDVGATVPN